MRHRGGAVVLAALASGFPLSATASAAVPGTFDVSTLAVGVNASSTQDPAASVITAGLVDLTEAYSTSALSSYGTSESSAASFYPGDLVAGGPQLLCANFGPCPFDPPSYPLVADAAYPTSPSATAPGASAHSSSTDTGASATGLTRAAGPVTVEAAVASTRAWVDSAGAHVRSRSLVKGITVGPLHVAALEAVDEVDVPSTGAATDHPRVTVTGVTVAGQQATIDDKGVHVAGQDAGASVPALVQSGLSVRLLGSSRQDAEGPVRSAAGGLQVALSVPVTGVPQLVPGLPSLDRRYVGSVLIGGAGALVAAGAEAGLGLVAPPPAVPGSAGAVLTPPATSGVPPALPVAPPGKVTGPPPPQVAPPSAGSRGVALYPMASVETAALLLLVLPLVLFGLWRAYVARAWRT